MRKSTRNFLSCKSWPGKINEITYVPYSPPEAAAELKKASRLSPQTARLYYNAALVDAEMKRYAEATRNMKTYLLASPDGPDARAAKDEIVKWEFAMERRK